MTGGFGLYPPQGGPAYWEYRPRWMWDVGASEQDITNILEGIGGAGGYGSLSPPAMGWYGAEETGKVVLSTVLLCAGVVGIFGAGLWYLGKQMDKMDKGELEYRD